MKDKIKNASRRTLALFAAALLALGAGSIMSARAALNIVSGTFDTNLKMANVMEVTILEGKDNDVVDAGASAAILKALKDADGNAVNVIPGKVYDETLAVKNNSGRPMYVRMIVRKYWLDKNGKEDAGLDPSLIKLTYKGSDFNGDDWIKNDNEDTPSGESSTYYYKTMLTDEDDTTAPLIDGVSVDSSILKKYTTSSSTNNGKNVITYKYQYDGCSICLEVEAQAVQTHNAEDAIKSIWGVDATLSGDSIESVK